MGIATDPLSLLFIGCFLFGLVFFLLTALLGNLGHGLGHHGFTHQATPHVSHAVSHTVPHTAPTIKSVAPAHSTHVSPHSAETHNASLFSFVNPTSVVLFLLGFGFFGYVFHNTGHFVLAVTLPLALIAGIVLTGLLLSLLGRIFGDSEGATIQDVSDRTGLLGKVSVTIPEGGLGEILYTSPGGMHKSIPARSIDGRRIERGQEIVVVQYERGIAEVNTWDDFINEEGVRSESSSADGLAKLRALLDEADGSNTEMVIRKDLQKE